MSKDRKPAILALDTSTEYLTLAILKGGKTVRRFHRRIGRNHAALLIPAIDRLLKSVGIKAKDLDGLCVGIGPGSFTGLRIGVATVKGLSYALHKPVVTVPTLDAIAQNAAHHKGIICPVLDARKGKVYACLYRSDGFNIKRISKYLLLSVPGLLKKIESYDKVVFLGDAAGDLYKHFSKEVPGTFLRWQPRAEVIGKIGLGYFRQGQTVRSEDLEPLYLYSKECDITGI